MLSLKRSLYIISVNSLIFFNVSFPLLILPSIVNKGEVAAQTNPDAEAEKVFDEGIKLYQKGTKLYEEGTAESRRGAITKFGEALLLFKKSGNLNREATTLKNIGDVYRKLGEEEKAFNYFHQALPLANHGFANGRQPELSGVIMSLVDKNGNWQNGFLRLNDIFNLNLPAEVVVLSACQTAKGKDIKGEGLVGLTRGFMYAGAKRVVGSLWRVDDSGTAHLMSQFYQGMLEQELSPVDALRAAKLQMLEQGMSPYYWGAFTLQGEWE